MSIATLKKKIKAQYNNPHIGDKYGPFSKHSATRANAFNGNDLNKPYAGFSLNGTHRNQGYVGQTSLSRSLPTTHMRGDVARGSGGCCGKYNTNNGTIIQSAVTSTNDPNVVKSSVLNTTGMYHTVYRWMWRGRPHTTWKPDSSDSHHIGSQEYYIAHRKNKALSCTSKNTDCRSQGTVGCNTSNTSILLSNRNIPIKPVKQITKPEIFPLDESEYIQKLKSKCVKYNRFSLPNNIQNTPFACNIVK